MGIRNSKVILAVIILALGAIGYSQQPQTTTAPIYAVNAKYVNGVAPGYWSTKGSGLTLNVGAGTVNCNSTIVEYAGGTLTMANNTTNYVYLNVTSSCAPASNTSGYDVNKIPLAKVTTSGGIITAIDDHRTALSTATGTGAVTGGTCTNQAVTAISTSGVPTCTTLTSAYVDSSITKTIASGTAALGTGAVSSASCATVVTVSATGVATTDNIQTTFNADPTSTVGYQALTSGMLTIIPYPTTNNVNYKVCNTTSASITPGAVTLNWRVVR